MGAQQTRRCGSGRRLGTRRLTRRSAFARSDPKEAWADEPPRRRCVPIKEPAAQRWARTRHLGQRPRASRERCGAVRGRHGEADAGSGHTSHQADGLPGLSAAPPSLRFVAQIDDCLEEADVIPFAAAFALSAEGMSSQASRKRKSMAAPRRRSGKNVDCRLPEH
jgi:hypothetical protein